MQKISVLLPNPFSVGTYFSQEKLPAGTFVRVPFGRTKLTGVVWPVPPDESVPEKKIKKIESVLPCSVLPPVSRRFVEWVSGYTLAPLGLILKMEMPVDDVDKQSRHPTVFEKPVLPLAPMAFSKQQQKAIDFLRQKADGFSVTLIDGVTGSGKTEVYFESIAQAIRDGHQVLVLLPEITLTAAWLERFEKRFGVRPACWHSALTPKGRRDVWQAVLNNKAPVVVGARSALFLPFADLGLIVVDEEHDASYKQEDGVPYQARDMAIVRGQLGKIPVILASATPSLETFCNVQSGRFQSVVLPERFSGACLPDIRLIDRRTHEKTKQTALSEELTCAIRENLLRHEQTLLFLNRRGYAPLKLCRACGEKIKCPHCSVFLTEHKSKKTLMCHQCGYTRHLTDRCPSCGEKDSLISCGLGVERLEEEVASLFPDARIAVITSDTVSSPKQFEQICHDIESGKVDILIGTQMLAKGHNFPLLTLVGIVEADAGLSGGDLRASERTFQLLQQVSGRAGRHQKKGVAYLQTYAPQNGVIQAMADNDRALFMQTEIEARKLLSMPPFGRLAALIISGKNETTVQKVARQLVSRAPFIGGVEILGPVPAPLTRLRNKYRYRILVKTHRDKKIQNIISGWLNKCSVPSSVTLKVDIDPYSFL